MGLYIILSSLYEFKHLEGEEMLNITYLSRESILFHLEMALCTQNTNTAWLHLYELSKMVKIIQSKSGIMVIRGWGKGKINGHEFQLNKMNKL